MSETEQGWVDQAQYDLETARAMLASRRYPEEIRAVGSTMTRGLAQEVLRKTEQTIQWVLSIPT
jgi:hypothetical protein